MLEAQSLAKHCYYPCHNRISALRTVAKIQLGRQDAWKNFTFEPKATLMNVSLVGILFRRNRGSANIVTTQYDTGVGTRSAILYATLCLLTSNMEILGVSCGLRELDALKLVLPDLHRALLNKEELVARIPLLKEHVVLLVVFPPHAPAQLDEVLMAQTLHQRNLDARGK